MSIDIASCCKQAAAIAENLRLGRTLEVAEAILELISPLTALANQIPPQQLNIMHSILAEVLGAQEREDWLSMADYLEYELTDFLRELNIS